MHQQCDFSVCVHAFISGRGSGDENQIVRWPAVPELRCLDEGSMKQEAESVGEITRSPAGRSCLRSCPAWPASPFSLRHLISSLLSVSAKAVLHVLGVVRVVIRSRHPFTSVCTTITATSTLALYVCYGTSSSSDILFHIS